MYILVCYRCFSNNIIIIFRFYNKRGCIKNLHENLQNYLKIMRNSVKFKFFFEILKDFENWENFWKRGILKWYVNCFFFIIITKLSIRFTLLNNKTISPSKTLFISHLTQFLQYNYTYFSTFTLFIINIFTIL